MDTLKKIDAPMKVVHDTVLKLLIWLMVYNFIQFDVNILNPLFFAEIPLQSITKQLSYWLK